MEVVNAPPPTPSVPVTWDGPDDPENPKNWSNARKWTITCIVSSYTFISPVSSSMIAPALTAIGDDLKIHSDIILSMTVSVFVLAYSVGPLVLGPLSEMYGRVPVLQLSNMLYLVFNICCGFAQTQNEMIAFRFLSGLGGSAPLAIGGGVLGDCWKPEERGLAISIYSLAPLLGPAIGPIIGGFITQHTTWRWTFYVTSILDFAIQIFGLFFLRETYAPQILSRKAAHLRQTTGEKGFRTEFEASEISVAAKLRTSFLRPIRMLFTHPIIQILAVYMSFLYGLVYLLLTTFPALWTQAYGEKTSIGSLHYITLALGCLAGSQFGGMFSDRIYKHYTSISENNTGRAEFRVPLIFCGACIIPAGLFVYGWTAEYRVFWLAPDIGAFVFSAGTIMCFQCIQMYIVDAYTIYAASALASIQILRNLAGFGFPLFAPAMYAALGYGWGNSLLGFLALAIGIPVPLVLWCCGERLRKRSVEV